jgi:hypothetical protein
MRQRLGGLVAEAENVERLGRDRFVKVSAWTPNLSPKVGR